MRTTKVIIGLSAAAALFVAGCGTTEEAGGGERDTASGDPITVVDSRGKEVTLDGPATRVAATEWNGVEHLVSLGVMPVGVSDIEGYEQWVSAAPLDDTPKDIGTRGEPSTDALGPLDLDLLVVTDSLTEGALEQIEATTPVLVIEGGSTEDAIGSMFESIDMIAKATGTEERATELRTEFDEKIAEGKAAVEDLGATGDQFAFSDAYVDAGSVTIRPFAKGSLVGDVLESIGLRNAWPMEGDPAYGLASADVEGLTALPDVHFWYEANDSFGDPYADELANNAIWKELPFVKSGKVARFSDSLWMFGGVKSMEQYVDAAVEALKE
ncbi:ABC transporter substrate-binding protein [Prauserella marina]|uniref:Iron complex transport system substrate-binding protein n=1 Tax=Prauserella marina TaxID=530584 RepID=A0A222VKV5_9PSEU|nr:iron-siderophore ABC transporter substrate-binding protein [Prauserella marina]ASR34527.1 ABC transporter substrate-binding protein [Prauserella marina]PWV85868.1 iron complex transport system substrate-binding protein [Prauserella marina]SDC43515.1 iron complex transport system substrate-binding protein [Prauserella marina]